MSMEGKRELIKHGILERLAGCYTIIMLLVFPLYARFGFACDIAALFGIEWDGMYFDILAARFGFFWKLTLLFTIPCLLPYIWRIVSSLAGGERKIRELLSGSTMADKAFAAFLLLNIISMLFSGYPYESWWGSLGRSMGVMMWLMLFCAYLIITRLYRYRRWHIDLFLLSVALVSLWGITDFFHKDIFGFFEGVKDWGAQQQFASSVGNINSYTALTGFGFSLSGALLVYERRAIPLKAFTALVLFICSAASIMGLSDNALLSMGATLVIIPVFGIRSMSELRRYILLLAIFAGSIRLSGWITTLGLYLQAHDFNMGILLKLGRLNIMTAVALVLLAVYLLLLLFTLKEKYGSLPTPKPQGSAKPRGARETGADEGIGESESGEQEAEKPGMERLIRGLFLGLSIVAAAVLIFIIADANLGHHSELWEPYRDILIFSRSWGTGRGLAWSMAFDYFLNDMPLLYRIIGRGPESYYIITMEKFQSIMLAYGYGAFDNAHNEYINTLMTLGLAGLLGYLFLIGSLLSGLIYRQGRAIALSAGIALIAYCTQAVINFSVPMVYPLVIIVTAAALKAVKEL